MTSPKLPFLIFNLELVKPGDLKGNFKYSLVTIYVTSG